MRLLPRDRRGYPIPFVIMRDIQGKPHFTINDSLRNFKVLSERRCQICGFRLKQLMWFVGGPRSAFHEAGCYADSAMHHECMTYAMQVCPYLAVHNYPGRIDDATLNYDDLPNYVGFVDTTMDPNRPAIFVAVASRAQELSRPLVWGMPMPHVRPVRPYSAVEFWRHGIKLSVDDGMSLCRQAGVEPETCLVIAK